MKANKYIAPQVEVIEIEIEDAVLSLSGTDSDISGTSIDDLLYGTGRF